MQTWHLQIATKQNAAAGTAAAGATNGASGATVEKDWLGRPVGGTPRTPASAVVPKLDAPPSGAVTTPASQPAKPAAASGGLQYAAHPTPSPVPAATSSKVREPQSPRLPDCLLQLAPAWPPG